MAQASSHVIIQDTEQLQNDYNNLTMEKDRLKRSYASLIKENNQLKSDYSNFTQEKKLLQTSLSKLAEQNELLQLRYDNLTEERGQFQDGYDALVAERDQLQTSINNLTQAKDQQHISYNALLKERERLQTNNTVVASEREQLTTALYNLTRKRDHFEARYTTLKEEKDQLQRELEDMKVKMRDRPCQIGWKKFDTNCYYVSKIKRSWNDSRMACKASGADLVVINSLTEQIFVNGLGILKMNAWIGLMDQATEGTWTWVDGTPFTTAYWQKGQPNSYHGNQDCGEMIHEAFGEVGEWNDDGCDAEQFSICEK
ncbi:CD209 antigen-like protein E [Lampris incognitus]|uniref:CD209 antigen-like protein E n=1 Tax=Lampris incognitus TaxID=2546036 RepID=UPI0024B5B021|nr:CD209 antigen-like protein E [Lampris incognitus]